MRKTASSKRTRKTPVARVRTKPTTRQKKETVEVQKKRKLIVGIFVLLVLVFLGTVVFKLSSTFGKVSTEGSIFGSITRTIVEEKLQGEEEGRINVLLLGMRGENVPGGGLLADTIMVLSAIPGENKFSLVSIPRDFYVTMPGTSTRQKINAVYHYGEEKGNGMGMQDMKQVVSDIVGQPIHYASVINFAGFTSLVDIVGGIDLNLEESFIEPIQFHEERVCDPNVFTVPSGGVQQKIDDRGKIVAEYPLCYNSYEECGGVFRVPAGDVNLNGEDALCYVRSRVTSSDFDRARRQQIVIQQLKDKLTSAETVGSFSKVNEILNVLGDNVRTDMEAWEMKRVWDLAQKVENPQIFQKVLENSEEGLLYAPEQTNGAGYILLPRGNDYTRIQEMFANIFVAPPVPLEEQAETTEGNVNQEPQDAANSETFGE